MHWFILLSIPLSAMIVGPKIHRELSADHILGVGVASLTLAGLTVRRKVKNSP
ncbi:MAG: hypothetical protein ACETWQ_06950 [Phycisphaerae bacterium]